MGTLLDIINTVKDAVDSTDGAFKKIIPTGKQYRSIAQRASEGILQFPVLISGSIDIETAQNISKALERNYSTFAQVVFSMSPTFEYKKNMDVADYIKQFHQNSDTVNGPGDIINALKDNYNIFANDNLVFLSATYESATSKLKAINKEQLDNMLEYVRTDILNNKYKPKAEIIYNFSNSNLNKKYNNPLSEATNNHSPSNFKEELDANKFEYQKDRDSDQDIYTRYRDATRDDLERTKFDYQRNRDNNKDIQDRFKNVRDTHVKINTSFDNRDMLRDNDVKKANELIATTLHIRIKIVSPDNVSIDTLDFIIGIKAMMHVVKSTEMITNLVGACKNNDKVFNFIRWTTGEISFFRDFLFNIKEMKQDVTDRSKGASPWWIALKRRKALATLRDSMFLKKKILPNTTIVISADEAEYIKSQYGYDLYDIRFINKIMQTYYLLGFCIVDNSAQIAHFIFDNQTDMQSVSFSALEKANSSDERKFKEMLKVINRV